MYFGESRYALRFQAMWIIFDLTVIAFFIAAPFVPHNAVFYAIDYLIAVLLLAVLAMEPEVLWLLDNFPGYWNWARYMAIGAGPPLDLKTTDEVTLPFTVCCFSASPRLSSTPARGDTEPAAARVASATASSSTAGASWDGCGTSQGGGRRAPRRP